MIGFRRYLIQLPVWVSVSDAGTVTYAVQTADAAPAVAEEGAFLADSAEELLTVAMDVERVRADHLRRVGEGLDS